MSSSENKVPNPSTEDGSSHPAGRRSPETVARRKYIQFQGNTTRTFPRFCQAIESHQTELAKVACASALENAKTVVFYHMKLIILC